MVLLVPIMKIRQTLQETLKNLPDGIAAPAKRDAFVVQTA